LITQYPYLVVSLAMLTVFGLALARCPRVLCGPAVLSGLLSIPSTLSSCTFVPEYWSPVRIAEFIIGPEDVLFSFATGGIALLVAAWPFRDRISFTLAVKPVLRRFALYYAVGAALHAALVFVARMGPMEAALVTIALIGAYTLMRRSELVLLALTGAICFTLLYAICMKTGLLVFPGFLSQWNHQSAWALSLLGVPLGEIVWGVFCGAAWPVIAASMLGIQVQPRNARQRSVSHEGSHR